MSNLQHRERSPQKEQKINGNSSAHKNGQKKEGTTSNNDELIQQRQKLLNPMMQIHYPSEPLKIVKGEMQYLIDEEGNKYLDCANNVCHVGHCHPEVVEKINAQVQTLNTNSRYLHDEIVEYTKEILKTFPKELCVFTILNSGSEANDLALQFAQIHTKQQAVICVEDAYHGHVISLMDISPYKWNSNYPCPVNTIIASSPCQYRGKYTGPDASKKYAEELSIQIKDRKVSAFISEGLQSCAGQVIPPKDYFKEMFKVVRQNGGVCIIDEVQSGMGRVGSNFWSFQEFDVIPDMVTFGKAMGNGFPVAGIVTTREIADSFKNRGISYFNTYGGNPVACTAAMATLKVIQKYNLQENSRVVGEYLGEKLQILKDKYEIIGDIRGKGLFYGLDLVKDRKTKEHHPEAAEFISMECKARKILLNPDGIHHNIIKLKPPMVFTKENVDYLYQSLDEIFSKIPK